MPCRPKHKPSGRARYVLPGPNPGLVKDGNLDLYSRPLVKNGRNYSTVDSMSFSTDAGEVLCPTVVGNKILSERAAERHCLATKEQLGIFDSIRHANKYAERLHLQQARLYCLL